MKSHMRHFLVLALGLALVALPGCGGPEGPTGPQSGAAVAPPASSLVEDLGSTVTRVAEGLLACPALPETETTAWIGPWGGTIVAGPHRLVVPAGALPRPTLITMQVPSDPVASVELLPHGLTFARSARLTLSYRHCGLVASLAPKRIAYTTSRLVIIEYLLSIDNLLRREVTGELPHFSRYAVAW